MSFSTSLNHEQLNAIETTQGPLLVLAGAGSGKTRVVTYRIAHLLNIGIDPSAILALTFTNKAANEMKERVQGLTHFNVLICTFHGLGARILREFAEYLGLKRNFTIYDVQDAEKIMKTCIAEVQDAAGLDPTEILGLISNAKNLLSTSEDSFVHLPQGLRHIFPRLYECYQTKLKECNAVDFDDLLFLPVKLLREYPNVLRHLQNRWSHLLVDEYQDTNAAQYTLIRLLVAEHQNICVVGDPDQSIYSWRGANVGNILGFENDFPNAKVIRLEQNYRSRTNILNAANALIRGNSRRYEKSLWSDKGPGDKIKYFTADTEKAEADYIANRIRYHHEEHNIPLKEMAVFYRTNAQSRPFEDKFLSYGIPYSIVGGISFYQRKEIKDVLAFLKISQSPEDYIAFLRTINIPKRGIGEASLEKLTQAAGLEGTTIIEYCTRLIEGIPLKNPLKLPAKQTTGLTDYLNILKEIRAVTKECSIAEIVKVAIERTGYLTFLLTDADTAQERTENLNSLISKAIEWEQSTPDATLDGFLQELTLKTTLDEADTSNDKVSLMTIHNGKGLEFEVVFLAGLEEDLFPHANSRESFEALEEERRLCYVGLTRAKEFLYLCNVRQRMLWGTTRSQRPSRFIDEIPSEYIEKVRPSLVARPNYGVQKKVERWSEPQFIDDIDQTVEEIEIFEPGTTVFHKTFGVGVIRSATEGASGLMYKIAFSNDGRERTLMAKMAPLKRL